MALNFPSSPADGQTYTAEGRSWTWSAARSSWQSTTVVFDTPPTASQSANTVYSAPNGSAGTPVFRALVSNDLPNISLSTKVTGTLPTANGGTNLTTFTSGGAIYASSTSVLTSGTLPLASGGTGQTTKAAAFNALSPVTSTGDLILGNGTNSSTRLAIGTNGYVLTSNGTTASWQASSGGGGGVTSFSGGSTGLTPNTATTGAISLGGTLSGLNGGTGQSYFNYGDLIYGSGGTGQLSWLAISTSYNGAVLQSNGSAPYWGSLDISSLSGTLGANHGGTGTTTYPQYGQLLIGNGISYNVANLTAGPNITITNSYGGITIESTGGTALPSQAGQSGKYLTTNGTSLSWGAVSAGGGGPTISGLYVSVSGYSSLGGYAPTSNLSKPLIAATAMSPSTYGAFSFRSTSGNYNINGASINSINISDSAGGYNSYNSGTDFSGYPFNFRVDDSIVSCYGLSIYNAAMFTLFTDSENAMTSPNLGPFDAGSAYNNNSEITINTSTGSIYKTGGGGVDVEKSMPGYYYLRFGTGNSSYMSGFSVDSIMVKAGGIGTTYNTYYSGSDFYSSFAENTSFGMFQMQMQVYNPTLQTLLDNTFRA